MAAISSLFSPNLLSMSKNPSLPKIPTASISSWSPNNLASSRSPRVSISSISSSNPRGNKLVVSAATAEAAVESEVERRLYVGNIPREVDNEQLAKIFGEHGSVEKAEVMYDKYSGRSRRFGFVTMSTVEDANAAIEKVNDTEIGGRKIKVNVTEKPLQLPESSLLKAEDSAFTDSPYKVYVGNLAKTVTSEILSKFFSERGNVLGAKISRAPGTSKSTGFGFVSFSSEEDVEAAISSCNNAFLEGQRIRVNKA